MADISAFGSNFRKRSYTSIIIGLVYVAIFASGILSSSPELGWVSDISRTSKIGSFIVFCSLIGIVFGIGIIEIVKTVLSNSKVILFLHLLNFLIMISLISVAFGHQIYYVDWYIDQPDVVNFIGLSNFSNWALCGIIVGFSSLAGLLITVYSLSINSNFYVKNLIYSSFGFILVGSAAVAFIYLMSFRGWPSLVYLLFIPVAGDSFGYIFGSLFGKHKMAPSISPKKTWEGAIYGFMATAALTFTLLIIYRYTSGDKDIISKLVFPKQSKNINFLVAVILIVPLFVIGVCGDLVFSKLKREFGVKDFSNLLPGHGGIMDRIDSHAFVLFFYGLMVVIVDLAN